MMSFLLQREEEERVTAKNSKKAEPPACTKNRICCEPIANLTSL